MPVFIINLIFIILMVIILSSLTNTLIDLLFDIKEESVKNKRLKQIKKIREKKELEFKDLMDKIADPANRNILPRLKRIFPALGKTDLSKLERNLKLATWDDTFTPESFVGAVWGLRCLALPLLVLALFFSGLIRILLIILAVGCAIGLEYWLKSTVKGVESELFMEFPEFIRIVSGYLSADIPLVQSISDSMKYVGDAWQTILKNFITDCDIKSVDYALNRMKDTVDLFEVKEFISLIRLTLEQGGNVKEGFLNQADKIAEMQRDQLIMKIGKRKLMAQIIQGPLLMINILLLGLPTISQVMEMFSGTGGLSNLSF